MRASREEPLRCRPWNNVKLPHKVRPRDAFPLSAKCAAALRAAVRVIVQRKRDHHLAFKRIHQEFSGTCCALSGVPTIEQLIPLCFNSRTSRAEGQEEDFEDEEQQESAGAGRFLWASWTTVCDDSGTSSESGEKKDTSCLHVSMRCFFWSTSLERGRKRVKRLEELRLFMAMSLLVFPPPPARLHCNRYHQHPRHLSSTRSRA